MKEHDFSDKRLFNGLPLRKGMKIAPVVVQSWTSFISMGYKPENMETFKSWVHGGKKYPVAFIEVPEKEFENYMKRDYRDQINDYFDEYGEKSYQEKHSRCILEDGLRCPTRNCCGSCKKRLYPDKPELSEDENPYLKNIRSWSNFTSYDGLIADGYDCAKEQDDADVELLLKELLREARKVAEYYPTVITMTRDGYSKKEIIKKLGLEDNATSYRKVDKALKFAHDYLTD